MKQQVFKSLTGFKPAHIDLTLLTGDTLVGVREERVVVPLLYCSSFISSTISSASGS